MVLQRALLFERLEVAEAMRAFISHHLGGSKEMRTRLERVEIDLVAAQKAIAEGVEALKLAEGKREVICAKTDKLKKTGEATEVKFKGVD